MALAKTLLPNVKNSRISGKRLLLTGFEPFGDDPSEQNLNPSAAIAQTLHGEQIANWLITGHVLPCVYGDSVKVLKQGGAQYPNPKLEIFRGQTRTACGAGQAAMGPFYCPADSKVYIDLSFYETMKNKLGAPGDFAQAYVIAHEVGHHVQNALGISGKVDAMRGKISEREQNALSVRLELQADCYAGIWVHYTEKKYRAQGKTWLEKGDIEEAMNAAQQIGDDALQQKSQGRIVPDSFTHGTSQQRMRWFNQGVQTGSVKGCDTFSAKQL